MQLRLGVALWLFVATVATGSAQWINHPDPGIPRAVDGRPDLKAPAPRLSDGRLDLSGIWYPDTNATDGAAPRGQTLGEGPGDSIENGGRHSLPRCFPPRTLVQGPPAQSVQGPASRCLPHTIVDYYLVPAPFKLVHMPGLTILLFEEFQHFRQVFTDGRRFPANATGLVRVPGGPMGR